MTEFKASFGGAYLAPAYDMGSKEGVVWSVSESPNRARQMELLDRLLERSPEGASPGLHPDMGRER